MKAMSNQPPLLVQAIQLIGRGAYPQAIALLNQVVASHPQQLEPRAQLAKACLDWAQIQARVPLMEIETEKITGAALHFLQMARGQLEILARSHPSSHHVQTLLGILHLLYARPEEALHHLKKALVKAPTDSELLYNLGYALMELQRYPEAVTQFTRLTALHPRHGKGWQMLGQARALSGDPEAALPAYRQAIDLLPGWYQPYGALAETLWRLDRAAEAVGALRTCLAVLPDSRELNFSLASMALSMGDWATGWRYYACRTSVPRRPPFPEENGIPIAAGRPLRIRYDQGLGDELFFLAFLPALVARGIEIHYLTQQKLLPLLQGRSEFAKLKVAEPGSNEPFDMYVGDLPYLAGMTSTADIPPPLRLVPDVEKATALRRQLEDFGPPPYLGVTWQAGTPRDPSKKGAWKFMYKEISSTLLGQLAQNWPGTVVILQRLPRPEDMAGFTRALGRPALDWSGLNDDLTEALAGLSLLDDYVGVSNTNMHLLASIGRTARVLVPFPSEWRWMAKGDQSPWFPGFKIYRQSRDKSWDGALARLAQDLKVQYHSRKQQ